MENDTATRNIINAIKKIVPNVKTKWFNLKVKEIASPSKCVFAAEGDDGTPGLSVQTQRTNTVLCLDEA